MTAGSRSRQDRRQDRVPLPGRNALHYHASLHRYLVRRLHNAEDAHDLAQEAYLRYLQLPQAGLVREPAAYLFRIAVNLVYEFRMRRDRAPLICDSQTMEEAAGAARKQDEDIVERLSTEEQLGRVLAHIPPAYRRVLLMHKRDGCSYDEIAAALGLSKQSVQKYLARAIAYGRLAGWER